MATYQSPAIANKRPQAVHGLRRNVQMARGIVTCTAAPATTDSMEFFNMPLNAVIVGGYLLASDMDTNGSPALTLNIGDAGSATRLFSGSTVGQAGTLAQEIATTALGYQFTAKTKIIGTAGVNAATGAAGTVELCLLYTVEDATTS